MTPFDAIAHSFSTVSTGGNSTHDANLGYFDNEVIEGIAVFFMFLGGVNFSLHFLAWRHKRLSELLPRSGVPRLLSHAVAQHRACTSRCCG